MNRLQHLKAQRTRLENRACSLIFQIEHPNTPEDQLPALVAALIAVDADVDAIGTQIAAVFRTTLKEAAQWPSIVGTSASRPIRWGRKSPSLRAIWPGSRRRTPRSGRTALDTA